MFCKLPVNTHIYMSGFDYGGNNRSTFIYFMMEGRITFHSGSKGSFGGNRNSVFGKLDAEKVTIWLVFCVFNYWLALTE